MVGRVSGAVGVASGLIEVFTGLAPRTFRRLVVQVERRGRRLVADGIKGR
jgi:hypothetical protein